MIANYLINETTLHDPPPRHHHPNPNRTHCLDGVGALEAEIMTQQTNQTDINKRHGIIMISTELLFDGSGVFLKALFSQFFPYRIEAGYRLFKYYGMSYEFDPIEEGEPIPEYRAMVSLDGDDVTVTFENTDTP